MDLRAVLGSRTAVVGARSDCVWHVGAGDGYSLPWLAEEFRAIALFEPQLTKFDALMDARDRYLSFASRAGLPFRRILVQPYGLSDHLGADGDGCPYIETDQVLDTVPKFLPPPDLMVLTVPHPEAVLTGALTTLDRHAPVLLIRTDDEVTAQRCYDYLGAVGYAAIIPNRVDPSYLEAVPAIGEEILS